MRAYSCTHVIKQVDSGGTVTCIQGLPVWSIQCNIMLSHKLTLVTCLLGAVSHSVRDQGQAGQLQTANEKETEWRFENTTVSFYQSGHLNCMFIVHCSHMIVKFKISTYEPHRRPLKTGAHRQQPVCCLRNWLRQRKRCSDVHRWCALVCSDVMHVESGTHL